MSNLSNFASAGKAFANVMNKEGNDSAKKTRKDMNKTGGLKPRASLDTRPSPPPSKRPRTPESKTITARRRSSLATASLSTRNSADEPWTNPLLLLRKQPPNLQFRRGLLPFDLGLSVRFLSVRLPKQKRAVTTPNLILPNPNPHPWFGKHLENGWADFSTSNSFSNSSWEYRVLFASPNRMAKAVKAATSPGKGAQGTHSVKVQKNNVSDSSEGSVCSALLGSPLVRHVRQRSKAETPPAQNPGNMSHITEADSDDDEDYVEIMLAPIAAPGAPTPAMPRLQTMRNRSRFVPATPSKPLLPIHFEPPRQPRLKTKIVLPSSDQTLHQVATAASAMNLSYLDIARFRRCSYLTPPHHQPSRATHIHPKLTKEAASPTSLFATITITSAPSFLKLATSAPSFLNLLNPYVALPKDPHQPHPRLFVLLPV
ncbi:hypothetical protein F5879DRAFT_991230 [Lentinula edodes]|nr:hypothetical protein F5879DRAFT_991230 [Lentinula edodes]